MKRVECTIIGSGPAGYTAAIYAARADLKPILFTGHEMGGQLMTTTDVENFPGYPEGVMGPQMMEDLRKQAERFGTELHYEKISKVSLSEQKGGWHTLESENGQQLESKAVIITTGAVAKYLGLEAEQKLLGKGVSACAVCDGFFFKGQDVAVVGGGDSAAEEASYLAKICNKVYLMVRKDEMRASKVMQARVLNTPNIEVLFRTEVEDILGEDKVEAVQVVNNQTGEKREISVSAYFAAIGHIPNTSIFQGIIEMDSTGYIITDGKSSRTSVPGIFAAGDVQDKEYRQAITSAGTGCIAALDAERYLASLE